MKRYAFDLSMTVVAPFLFPGVAAGRYGLDAVALRNAAGDLVLPMDQIRGVLRHAVEELSKWASDGKAAQARLTELFGERRSDATEQGPESFEPRRGRLFLSDLTARLPARARKGQMHPRVKIDVQSGAAAEGQLVFLEALVPAGDHVTFTGELAFYADESEAAEVAALFKTALTLPLSIGACKTIGFGLINHEATSLKPRAAPTVVRKAPAGGSSFTWHFGLDRPYLVNAERVAGNAYLGSEEIPGGALKGCLARNLELNGVDIAGGEISAALAAMRISFARPASGRHGPLPASLALDRNTGKYADLIGNAYALSDPVFAIDWKRNEKNSAVELLGMQVPDTQYEERVHTKIDPKLGTAEAGMLFSTIAVLPPKDGFVAQVSMDGVPEEVRMELLKRMAAGLDGLGRTGAFVETVGFQTGKQAAYPNAGLTDIILRMPALAAQYEDGEGARDAYKAFWAALLPHSKMSEFYAAQRSAGGYQARRFRPDNARYRPWLLTEPGAVFRLDVDERDLEALQTLLKTGVCRKTFGGAGLDWRNCPFVKENGYGEIAIHRPI